jgi:hypothetical protein
MIRLLTLFVLLAAIAAGQTPLDHQVRQSRPIALGTSGGNFNDAGRRFCCGGTLGALVQDTNGTFYILSNNHAISMSNFGTLGGLIVQPSLIDGNCVSPESDSVATLASFVPLIYKTSKVKWRNIQTNHVDAAIAAITPGDVQTNGAILEIGPTSAQTVQPFVGMAVKKSGRTTGLTHGTVAAVDVTFIIKYSKVCGKHTNLKAIFDNQISITPAAFSGGGDSGSLIVEDVADCPRPVGLLFGGGRSDTVANRIDDVLAAFNVSLVGCAAPAALVAPATLATQTVTPLIPGAKPEAIQTAQRAKRTHQGDLFQIHGVVGTGLSRSATDPTQPVIHIYVERDTPALRRLLPHDLDGVPVQIIESGKIVAR